MEYEQLAKLRSLHRSALGKRPVHVLEIPDQYPFMDPKLVQLIQERVEPYLSECSVE